MITWLIKLNTNITHTNIFRFAKYAFTEDESPNAKSQTAGE